MSKKNDTPGGDTPKKHRKAVLKEIEVQKQSLELELLWMDVEGRRDSAKRTKHVSQEQGIFYLEGPVTRPVCSDLSRAIMHYARRTAKKQKPITLFINSGGGDIIAGFALYDTLRTLSAQDRLVTTVVRGYAASMAGILFLAGDVRLIGAESFVHVHEPSTGIGGKRSEIQDELAFIEQLHSRGRTLYTTRTKITEKEYNKNVDRREWWLDSKTALELGVATNIG